MLTTFSSVGAQRSFARLSLESPAVSDGIIRFKIILKQQFSLFSMLDRPAVLLDFSTSHYLGLASQHCITTSRENRLYGLMDSSGRTMSLLLQTYNAVQSYKRVT